MKNVRLVSETAVRIPGFHAWEHTFEVPLSHPNLGLPAPGDGLAKNIQFFVKQLNKVDGRPARGGAAPAKSDKPYLIYLQGGPGFPAPSIVDGSIPGWVSRAAKDYTVLLIDQRGTGRSTPVTTDALTGGSLTPAQQAEYLSYFRADSIVADLEAVRPFYTDEDAERGGATSTRGASEGGRWSLIGQSYGGFLITRYATCAPGALDSVFFTGGIPITAAPAGASSMATAVYQAAAKRVLRRNARYYEKYPGDVERVRQIVDVIRAAGPQGVALPRGGRLTVARFASVGIAFGFHGGFDSLHGLVATAFLPGVDGTTATDKLSLTFLRRFEDSEPWETNPIYAILHESIYCDGDSSNWAAESVVRELPEFAPLRPGASSPVAADGKFYFTGEMVFPWMFDDCAANRPLKPAADLLAERKWPRLYAPPATSDAAQLRAEREGIRGAAVVYYDDMYVEREFSEATAQRRDLLPNMQLWVTNEFDHGGLRSDGSAVVERLFALASGDAEIR